MVLLRFAVTMRFIICTAVSDDVFCAHKYSKGVIHGAFRSNNDEPG